MNKHFNKDGKARNDNLSAVLGDAWALGSAQWLVGMTHRRPKPHLLSFQAFVILTSFHVELPYEPICVSAGVMPYHPVYSGYGNKGKHSFGLGLNRKGIGEHHIYGKEAEGVKQRFSELHICFIFASIIIINNFRLVVYKKIKEYHRYCSTYKKLINL